MLILIAGLPGTGKTTFARSLAAALDMQHLNSDLVRNSLGKRGQYTSSDKISVYEEMLRKTEGYLKANQSVVLDATFYKKMYRRPFVALAKKYQTPIAWIEVSTAEETIRQRLEKKRPDSEADFEVYQKIKAEREPITESHLALWSDQLALEEMVKQAKAYLVKEGTENPVQPN